MRITLAQIEAFYWTAQLGSVQKAAGQLNLAQPTVSLRLKELNASLGVDLFHRTSRGLEMTVQGRDLLPRAKMIMAEMRGIQEQEFDPKVIGPLRVGLAEGFAVTCLAPLLAGLSEDYPELEPEWIVSTSTTLETLLVENRLDVAVLLNPLGNEKLELRPLGPQPTRWVAPTAWNLNGSVTPKVLADKPIISNPPPSAMYRQVTHWFALAGLKPAKIIICNSVAVIAELVSAGLGAGILPTPMAKRYAAGGTIQFLTCSPEVENGRLFVGFRTDISDSKISAFEKTTQRVLAESGYLSIEPERSPDR